MITHQIVPIKILIDVNKMMSNVTFKIKNNSVDAIWPIWPNMQHGRIIGYNDKE